MNWCWDSSRGGGDRPPCCFVDFWRKPPPLISFGVERQTLAYWRYHLGISPCYSGDPVQWLHSAASERARVKERVCVAAQDRGVSYRFLLTQFRASQGASFEPPVISFWRWNVPERNKQPDSAQRLRKHIWSSKGYSGADTRKPFQPITQEARTIVSSHTSSVSANGIIRAHSHNPRGGQTPRGDIQSFIDRFFSTTVTRISLENRALLLRHFSVHSDKYSHQGQFSNICSSYSELPDCVLSIYLCMHKSAFIFWSRVFLVSCFVF